MTENELREEAKNRYPIGTRFKSLYQNDKEEMHVLNYNKCNTHLSPQIWFDCYKENNNYHSRNGCVYKDGKWAEIISYPEGYIPKSTNLLKQIIIW